MEHIPPDKEKGAALTSAPPRKVIYIHQDKLPQHKTQAPPRFHPPFLQSIEKIHAQGPRATAELILEIAGLTERPYSVGNLVRRYAALPPGTLKGLGVEQIPHSNPHEVQP